jgi:hypothetical protein
VDNYLIPVDNFVYDCIQWYSREKEVDNVHYEVASKKKLLDKLRFICYNICIVKLTMQN